VPVLVSRCQRRLREENGATIREANPFKCEAAGNIPSLSPWLANRLPSLLPSLPLNQSNKPWHVQSLTRATEFSSSSLSAMLLHFCTLSRSFGNTSFSCVTLHCRLLASTPSFATDRCRTTAPPQCRSSPSPRASLFPCQCHGSRPVGHVYCATCRVTNW
jgi:hypothetical protein